MYMASGFRRVTFMYVHIITMGGGGGGGGEGGEGGRGGGGRGGLFT